MALVSVTDLTRFVTFTLVTARLYTYSDRVHRSASKFHCTHFSQYIIFVREKLYKE